MSIGKSSIARAVNATASKTKNVSNDLVITKFSVDKIGELSIARTPLNIDIIKSNIAKRGVLCPILVAITPKGDVWLVDGYRRFFAAKELGLSELNATVINVQNKTEANRIYAELCNLKPQSSTDEVHEEKFRVLAVKDHDLPAYLL